jgi:hypothetical protein
MKCKDLFCVAVLSALVPAGSIFVLSVPARSADSAQATSTTGSQTSPTTPSKSATSAQGSTAAQPKAGATRPAPVWEGTEMRGLSHRAEMYYQTVWGVSDLRVKSAESGELIRFDYRVLDPEKAAALNDKKVEPQLIDTQGGVKLSVPELEKVGKLRQSSTPKTGMTYWMAFANPTYAVKRGHKVDVIIGSFRATSLVVE